MQPTAVLDVVRSGDLGGHKVAMKFDANSIAHIMGVLTDLYSDAELAIIREYSTNAWDSHVEAGQTRPIEVYTPTNLSPFFRVKDYGVGMDLDDIENIYSQYGASTKRETNEQNGMLGLGCKSALTYTNQFTVVAVKNGIKTSVMISRVEDGTGVMEILFQKPTDEPNGVEVVIPVRFSTTFEQKVREFFSYWNKGTVLLNDREPESFKDKAKQIGSSEIYMVPGNGSDKIVMGNVAYPVNSRLSGTYASMRGMFHTVAIVPIGKVNFVPAREALNYTQRTQETIREITAEFRNAIANVVQKDINSAADKAEAVKKYYEWRDMLGQLPVGDFTFKGEQMVLNYKADKDFWHWNTGAYRNQMSREDRTDYKMVMKTLTVFNFEVEKVTATMRKKVQMWMDDNGHYQHVFFMPEVVGSPWTDGSPRVNYDDIKALRLPSNGTGRVARTAKYDVITKHGYTEETDDIDDTQNIYYMSPADWKGKYGKLANLFPNDVLVSIGKNRFTKFKRDFPNALPIEGQLQRRMNEVRDMLDKQDFTYLSLDQWSRNNIGKFEADRFDDPALSTYVKAAASVPSDNTRLFQSVVSLLQSMGYYSMKGMEIPKQESPFKAYPLVGHIGGSNSLPKDHIYLYCNAVYNSKKN